MMVERTNGKSWPLIKVISGGQTGADQGGLFAARDLGIPTGGTAPHGYRTEDGQNPALADLGLVEHQSSSYADRTLKNVIDSDGTIVFGDASNTGSFTTVKSCHRNRKPCLRIPFDPLNPVEPARLRNRIREWIIDYEIAILNIAGNRESTAPGIGEWVEEVLREALR